MIAPWREWDLLSRDKLLAYADKHGIPVDFKKRKGGAPYSMDANLLHISYEGGVLEDPDFAPEESMWRITVSPEKAPAKPQVVELDVRARRHRRDRRREAHGRAGARASSTRSAAGTASAGSTWSRTATSA